MHIMPVVFFVKCPSTHLLTTPPTLPQKKKQTNQIEWKTELAVHVENSALEYTKCTHTWCGRELNFRHVVSVLFSVQWLFFILLGIPPGSSWLSVSLLRVICHIFTTAPPLTKPWPCKSYKPPAPGKVRYETDITPPNTSYMCRCVIHNWGRATGQGGERWGNGKRCTETLEQSPQYHSRESKHQSHLHLPELVSSPPFYLPDNLREKFCYIYFNFYCYLYHLTLLINITCIW